MGTILKPEELLDKVEGYVDWLQEQDEDYVVVIGDIGDLKMTSPKREDVKKFKPNIVLPDGMFEADGIGDLYDANTFITGTMAFPESALSGEVQKVLDGEKDGIGVDGDG